MVNSAGLNAQPIRGYIRNNSRLSSPLSFKSSNEENTTAENENLDLSRAAKQFGKGLISPITSIFSSPASLAMTAGVATAAAYVIQRVKHVAPILVGAGVALGTIQTAIGINKAVKAKNAEGKEKAIYDIGEGIGIVGLSVLTAKDMLSSVIGEQAASKMGMFKATWESLKGIPKRFAPNAFKTLNDNDLISDILSTALGKDTPKIKITAKPAQNGFLRRLFPTAAEGREVLDKENQN